MSASSTVFKNIIRDNNTSNPVIYLRGILSYEIESILQFIYLGQTTIYQERMNEFLDVGKSLEIKEISKDVEATGNEPHYVVQSNETKDENVLFSSQAGPQNSNEIIASREKGLRNSNHKSTDQDNSLFYCNKCDKQFSGLSGLFNHKKSVHEGVKYTCN